MNAGLPRAAAPFVAFPRLLRSHGFSIAPEQVTNFLRAVELLGPRDMEDIRQGGLATLAPPPDRYAEFDALFRQIFYGETPVATARGDDEEVRIRDGAEEMPEQSHVPDPREGGALAAAAEQLSQRRFDAHRQDDILRRFHRSLPDAMLRRRSFRSIRTPSQGRIDLRRALRSIVQADGDIPRPDFRRRKSVQRKLLLLIDVSGSMKAQTENHLKLAHVIVQAGERAEVFTFGTQLTRITAPLRIRSRVQALERAAALVGDWDGGTRIGPALQAFLSVPRYSTYARGAAVIILSDGLERGDHREMEKAVRRLSAMAFRLSLCTPLAGDKRFRPETAALVAILPVLDDLVDGSSVTALTRFILSLARPAPAAATIWRQSHATHH